MTNVNNSKYVRSFGGVLFRGIITLGVGIWIYMYTVLRHLQDEVSYQDDDFSPAKTRTIFGWLIFLSYVVPGVCIYFLAPQIMREMEYNYNAQQGGLWGRVAAPPTPSGRDQMLSGILPIAVAAMWAGMNFIMIRVLSVSQERTGIRPFDKTVAWILLAIGAVLQLISETNVTIILASWGCGLVLLYIIVNQSNRVFAALQSSVPESSRL